MDRLQIERDLEDRSKELLHLCRRWNCGFYAPLDPSTASELSGYLAMNITIKEFRVHSCRWSRDALKSVLEGLAENDTLQSLYIDVKSKIKIEDSEEMFTKMFETKLCLKHLSLVGCRNQPSSFVSLAAMLETNTTLQVLRLSEANIHLELVASALAKNQTLVELDLSTMNPFCPSGTSMLNVNQLANALRSNSTLEILRLERFYIGRYAALLADALCVNCTVKVLSLKSCDIGQDGAVALGKMIRKNDVLEELNLHDTGVGELGGQELLDGLQHNRRLKKLIFLTRSTSTQEKLDFW
jgi:Ran GTPase-activating protein (RanGAP) involved in mRNA processing and transport